MYMQITLSIFLVLCLISRSGTAQLPSDQPRPIPLTRPEMKALLEDVKNRTPRIPLPALTEEDRLLLGDRAESYEARLRFHYLGDRSQAAPRTAGSNGVQSFARNADANMTLDYAFKVELFWIVSRTNNCQYCLGHQESKLLGAGLSEDRIASLDGDWKVFTPKEQAAYAFARKVTFEPHLIDGADLELMRKHFTNDQITEILMSIAWNNSINRWKEGVGVPQSPDEGGYSRLAKLSGSKLDESLSSGSYLTPTSAEYAQVVTRVAPLQMDEQGKPMTCVVNQRPALESREVVLRKLEECRQRSSRLPLVDEGKTRQVLGIEDDEPVENWMRLIALFPNEATRRFKAITEARQHSELSPLTQAQVSWIVARQDRAWYAIEKAYRQLRALEQSDEQVFALDQDWSQRSESDQALFRIALHLAASPVLLTDAEVARGIEVAGPAAVVQTINFVTQCAAFDRLTEVAGLAAE